MKGIFITFEGPDGSGKTTQMGLLARHLGLRGLRVLCTREPGGTPMAEAIRQLLLSSWPEQVLGITEVFLYAASRAQHVRGKILPALEAGRVVLSDRFVDSSLAYQGFGRGLDPELVRQVNDLATGGLTPHLTLLLDLPPEEGLRRSRGEGRHGDPDRFEQEDLDFHRRVREGYLELARREPGRFKIIDATGPQDEVFRQVWEAVEPLL
ncbi:MAG: dTMP kinase [Thermoanaerobacteraceae bacterium]|uniref:dTMP kinase n=1 Tax=Thermanaeromonas sp. C210 TaxID=2731925 RepID=UPI00155D3D2F|nr:dTMP kinase [Thermanaeromonas sp. C210]MBE3580869.1 dTMP kinase [Thermoanaerobacteraceae bacterium]GFN21721.1 thymidylate kinase [Thermanaeromonas sp. C210]